MFAVERLSITRTAPRCLDVSLWDLFGMKSGTRREKVKHYSLLTKEAGETDQEG